MGFKVKKRVKLKKTTNEPDLWVSRFDPAVDIEQSDFEAYDDTNDEKHLVLLGDTPCRFEVRALEQGELQACVREARLRSTRDDGRVVEDIFADELLLETFRRGCTRILGLEVESETGEVERADVKASKFASQIPREVHIDIGAKVLAASTQSEDEAHENDVGK